MYIEFNLVNQEIMLQAGSGSASDLRLYRAYVTRLLGKELQIWSDYYDITYRTKQHKGMLRVTFDDDKNYSFFAMTWSHSDEKVNVIMPKYRFIEPMKVL